MKPLLDCYSLIRSFSFKQKVLIMHVGGIKLKAILRRFTFFIKEIQNRKTLLGHRFTFFIKEIQNRKTLLGHSFADIKPYLVLL